jgi:hypothetical protein
MLLLLTALYNETVYGVSAVDAASSRRVYRAPCGLDAMFTADDDGKLCAGVSYSGTWQSFADLSRRLVLGSSSASAAEVAYDIADDVADRCPQSGKGSNDCQSHETTGDGVFHSRQPLFFAPQRIQLVLKLRHDIFSPHY